MFLLSNSVKIDTEQGPFSSGIPQVLLGLSHRLRDIEASDLAREPLAGHRASWVTTELSIRGAGTDPRLSRLATC